MKDIKHEAAQNITTVCEYAMCKMDGTSGKNEWNVFIGQQQKPLSITLSHTHTFTHTQQVSPTASSVLQLDEQWISDLCFGVKLHSNFLAPTASILLEMLSFALC